MRVALGLEYDGTAFCGWQTQPAGCGVQDAVERAIRDVASEPVSVVCAGRTDAGVHALCQVIHFDTGAARPRTAWVRGVNSALGEAGVAVLWAREVDETFHARYAAMSRRYQYLLLNRPQRPGLFASQVGWFHTRLDENLMQAAARRLIGEHDFSAFRAAECQAKSAVRTVHALAVRRSGNVIVIDIVANAFLHHMVRNIVGALVYVGSGRQPPRWVGEVLETGDRTLAAPTFAAQGLYLCGVEYAASYELPSMPAAPLPGILDLLQH